MEDVLQDALPGLWAVELNSSRGTGFDLEYAVDIALLSDTAHAIQQPLYRLLIEL